MNIISVIMPVFNADQYVAESIDSVLSQTFRDFEFIIVDDGSTDKSLSVLKAYAERDSRIHLISRPNTGIVGALNDGLAEAKGEFVARMDADDLCRRDRFELQVKRLREEPGLVVLGSCATAIDPTGSKLGLINVPLSHEEIESKHLAGHSSIFHPAAMIRTESLRAVGGYRQGTCPCEDYDLWLRLGEMGRLENLKEPLFIWRKSATGLLIGNVSRVQTSIEMVLRDAWTRRNLTGEPIVPHIGTVDIVELYRQWAWLALKNGHIRTARRYAIRHLTERPWAPSSWHLFCCAARGW